MKCCRQSNNALIIFSKYPEPGKVKTRLAKTIGFNLAASTHRYFIQHIIQKNIVKTARYDTLCAVAPAGKISEFAAAFPGCYDYFAQSSAADLGQRLEHAVKIICSRGYNKLAIIGTDSPDLPANYIDRAFAHLEVDDLVLGPTTDGGYSLIAMKQPLVSLFSGIRWSSKFTLQDTLHVASREQFNFTLLPEHFDVDEADDLHRLLAGNKADFLPADLRIRLRKKIQVMRTI